MGKDTAIAKQIESSAELTKKLGDLVEGLTDQAVREFKKATGAELPSILTALVRELDTSMVYSTTPSVDGTLASAQDLLTAAIGGNAPEIVLSSLSVVKEVAQKVIGTGEIEVGVHSGAANTKGVVTAVVSVTALCSQKDWLTQRDFYTDQYILCVFRPTPALTTILHPHLRATS